MLNHLFALGESTITARTTVSFAINALIIVSTIYAQDFHDEIGDKCTGRRTIPILWPEGSRIGIFMVLAVWSIGLVWACDLGSFSSVSFCTLATFVGLRYYRKRTAEADQRSFRYYNIRRLLTQFVDSSLTFCTFVDMACCGPSRAYPGDHSCTVTVMTPNNEVDAPVRTNLSILYCTSFYLCYRYLYIDTYSKTGDGCLRSRRRIKVVWNLCCADYSTQLVYCKVSAHFVIFSCAFYPIPSFSVYSRWALHSHCIFAVSGFVTVVV